MRHATRRKALWGLALLLAALVWCALYGPLLPWSPWKPGYTQFALLRADIATPAGRPAPQAYRHVDEYIAYVERELQLPLHRRLHVMLLKDWAALPRVIPFYSARPGAVTLETGAEIYVTPRLDEKGYDHGEFLRHEITHALIRQNSPAWNYHRLSDSSWIFEGYPVWVSRPKSFLTPAEFLERAKSEPLALLFLTPATSKLDYRFAYVAWRNFLEYLSQRHGHPSVVRYLHGVMEDRSRVEPLFAELFGNPLAARVEQFQSELRDGRFTPVE